MSPVPRIVLTLGQDKEKEKKGRDKRLRRREPIVPTTTIWSGFALHVNPAAMPNHPLDTTTGVTVSVTTYVYLHTRLAWDDVMDIVAIINRPSGEERVCVSRCTI
jgi:hypothetical protein